MQEKTVKILQVFHYSNLIHFGGGERIAQTISEGLRKQFSCAVKDWTSDVAKKGQKSSKDVADSENIFMPSFDLVAGFPVPKFLTKTFWQQAKDLKNWKPDVIITHTRFFLQSMMGGIFAKIWGCTWLHIEHGSGFVTGYPRHIKACAWIFDRTIGLWIFRQCDTVVTISEMHKQFIKKFTNKEPVVIYNPVDYKKQDTSIKNKDTSIKNQGDSIHIGFIGRLVPLKGVHLLIDALKALEETSWQCTIVGDGSERLSLEQQVKSLGLEDRISFIGSADRADWLPTFDILVNPSYQEGVPTTVIEGLMEGCIVVATDVGGTREISDKEDLLLIESGNALALKTGIEKAIHALQKSGLSKEVVEGRFGVYGSIEKYRKLIPFGFQNATIPNP